MPNNLNELKNIVLSNPLIIGIGNELRGDDAAGIILSQKVIKSGYKNVLKVHSTPENFLSKISEMPGKCRLWIDIINWEAEPGSFRIFTPQEVKHFAISTHNFSPVVLLAFLKQYRDIPDYFLGIQPEIIELGQEISPAVNTTVNKLADFIISHLTIK